MAQAQAAGLGLYDIVVEDRSPLHHADRRPATDSERHQRDRPGTRGAPGREIRSRLPAGGVHLRQSANQRTDRRQVPDSDHHGRSQRNRDPGPNGGQSFRKRCRSRSRGNLRLRLRPPRLRKPLLQRQHQPAPTEAQASAARAPSAARFDGKHFARRSGTHRQRPQLWWASSSSANRCCSRRSASLASAIPRTRCAASSPMPWLFKSRVLNDLQRSVMKIRMVPVDQLFRRFPRIVRDVARQCGREVDLELSGQETDLDKGILDAIAEPLTHLVRNAVSHGIEPPDQRRSQGKPPRGRIRLNAYHQGNQVVVEISRRWTRHRCAEDSQPGNRIGHAELGRSRAFERGRDPGPHLPAGLQYRRGRHRSFRTRGRHGRGAERAPAAEGHDSRGDSRGPGNNLPPEAAAYAGHHQSPDVLGGAAACMPFR